MPLCNSMKELEQYLYGRSDKTRWVAESINEGREFDSNTWRMRLRTIEDGDYLFIDVVGVEKDYRS